MQENIIKNQVIIRGMLVGRSVHDNRTTLVVCSQSQNKDHSNYQYISFEGKLKQDVDSNYELHDMVTVQASVQIFRTREEKLVSSQNIRLHGIGIEKTRDFTKRVIAQSGIPIYGIQIKDCVRFDFSGTIASIQKTAKSDQRLSVLLRVQQDNRDGYNLIPLMYNCRPGQSADDILAQHHKGTQVCVRGFVAQRKNPNAQESRKVQYINTYYITSFLHSTVDIQIDEDAVVDTVAEAVPIQQ